MQAASVDPTLVAAITIFGSGRLGPTLSALLGLVGTVIGSLVVARANGRPAGSPTGSTALDRRGIPTAFVLGALSLALGVVFLATADSGPGTGNGVVGSGAAIAFGVAALVLGALARNRRLHLRSTALAPLAARSSDDGDGRGAAAP